MKVWVLFFVAAVWVQMPSEGSAKHFAPAARALSPSMLADISKRYNAHVQKRSESSEEADQKIREFLESDEVDMILAAHGSSMKELDELVDNDDDIDAEDKDFVKLIVIFSMMGVDITDPSFWDDLEKRSLFKK